MLSCTGTAQLSLQIQPHRLKGTWELFTSRKKLYNTT